MTKSKSTKLTQPTQAADPKPTEPKGKLGQMLALLRREQGATLADMTAATGWQAHSVRGAMSGAIKKKLGVEISSEKTETGRVYRVLETKA